MDSNRYRITGGMEPENLSGRRPQQRASAPRQANAQPQRRPQTVQQPQRQLRTPQQSAQRPGGAPVIRSGQSVQPLKKSKKKNGRGALKAVIVLLVLAIVSVLGVAAVHAFMLDKPEVRITNTVSGLRLEWEGVENAANYEIFKNSGEWKQLKTTDKTAYTERRRGRIPRQGRF